MRSFFSEYGRTVLVIFATAILLIVLGHYNIETKQGSGLSNTIGNSTAEVVEEYKGTYFDTQDYRKK